MKAKYLVRLEKTTTQKKVKKLTEFTVDPKIRNRFYIQIDYWNRVVIDVDRKRWWEFWK